MLLGERKIRGRRWSGEGFGSRTVGEDTNQYLIQRLVEEISSTHRFLSGNVVLNGGSTDPACMADHGILRRLHKLHDLWPHLHVFDIVGIVDQLNQLEISVANVSLRQLSSQWKTCHSVLTISKSSNAKTRSLTVCASSIAISSFSRIITASLFPMM
jgi:hypothetical protein